MQLVAYGAQDVYLTGSPQITFFKLLYRRHTNFSIEAIEQTFSGVSKPGQRCQAVISRNGDLLHKMYLQVKLPALTASGVYVNKLGHALIRKAEVEIGGQIIDRTYGRWMDLWHGLTAKSEKDAGYAEMTGVKTGVGSDTVLRTSGVEKYIYIPINFWFSKGSCGAALPLIALQYHEVKITLELAPSSALIRDVTAGDLSTFGFFSASTSAPDAADLATFDSDAKFALYADFIYLDTEERRRFAQTSHEYLIEQVQHTGEESLTNSGNHSYRLNFNHPCKALYWQFVPDSVKSTEADMCDPFWAATTALSTVEVDKATTGVTSGAGGSTDLNTLNPIKAVKLQLNGHERFTERPGSYFSLVQPFQHHTRIPVAGTTGMYSFCISPEEHQPSGALNMSRVDTANLQLTMANPEAGQLFVYAVNYNVLRILSGMGGLAFSN